MTEIWKRIPLWATYEVSTLGNVRSVDRTIWVKNPRGVVAPRKFVGRVLTKNKIKSGYEMVSLTSPKRKRRYAYVHDLVLEAFVGNKPKGKEMCHNNGVRADNRLENLRYDTRSANAQDCVKHGTCHLLRQNRRAA